MWYGLECSGGRVISADLFMNNQAGTLPTEIGLLKNLSLVLDITNTRMSGTLPSELGLLTNLRERVDFYGNSLSGYLPSQVGQLSLLTQRLVFEWNSISGTIPSQYGRVTNLERYMIFQRNRLSGTLPGELKALRKVVWLGFEDNRLSGTVPSELSHLSALAYIDLCKNQLTGRMPSMSTYMAGPLFGLACPGDVDSCFGIVFGSLMAIALAVTIFRVMVFCCCFRAEAQMPLLAVAASDAPKFVVATKIKSLGEAQVPAADEGGQGAEQEQMQERGPQPSASVANSSAASDPAKSEQSQRESCPTRFSLRKQMSASFGLREQSSSTKRDVDTAAERALRKSQMDAARTRLKVTAVFLVMGVILMAVFVPFMVHLARPDQYSWSMGLYRRFSMLGFALFAAALFSMLLSVLPTDDALISVLGAVMFVACAVFSAFCISKGVDEGSLGGVALRAGFFWPTAGIAAALASISLVPTVPLSHLVGVPDGAARINLRRLWRTMRALIFAVGVSLLSSILSAYSFEKDWMVFGSLGIFPGYGVAGAGCLIFFSCVTFPAARRRAHAQLRKIVNRGQTVAAAGVAALISGVGVGKSVQMAKRNFKVMDFGKLSESDFTSNKDTGLNQKVEPCELGQADAFISHSWHDAGGPKWRALKRWASEFKAKKKREPLVWLDKASIDQSNIAESLACLPIYLAGCQWLVIIIGQSYVHRLWCVMEVYTYLRMGGSKENIRLYPIGNDPSKRRSTTISRINKLFKAASSTIDSSNAMNQAIPEEEEEDPKVQVALLKAAQEAFLRFSVEEAHCFLQDDEEKLLGVIESGFGDFTTFNEMVRQVFAELLQIASEEQRKKDQKLTTGDTSQRPSRWMSAKNVQTAASKLKAASSTELMNQAASSAEMKKAIESASSS